MEKLHHPSYSLYLSPCDSFQFTLLYIITPDADISILTVLFFSVCRVCLKRLHLEPGFYDFKLLFCQRRKYKPVKMSKIWISPIMRLKEP